MSRLTSLPFNEAGPVIVPLSDFKTYQANSELYGNFSKSSGTWRHQTANDNILRLCIRDLLRQHYHTSYGYYQMGISYTQLLHGSLYRVLQKSEVLRTQFVEEALYNIGHRLVPPSGDEEQTQDELTELIELLLILKEDFHIETIDGEKLWASHPVNQPSGKPFEQAWRQLEFCSSNMCHIIERERITTIPRYYEQSWELLKLTITQCIKICSPELEQRHNVYSSKYPYNPHSIAISAPDNAEEMLTEFCNHIYYNSWFTQNAIDLLETELPDGVRYLPFEKIQRILPQLSKGHTPNQGLACYCLQRHINACSDTELLNLDYHFLHWAIGLTARGHNLDGGKAVARLSRILPPFK